MGRLSAKLRNVEGGLVYWCPGCDDPHVIMTTRPGGPQWEWDGNVEAPTFSPSIRATIGSQCCHHFVRAGKIEFLSDSTHKFAGQTVDLPDWPHAEDAYGGV